MEFEFAHLLDAVGAVQPHPAQLPAFQSAPSDLIPSAPPRTSEPPPSAPSQPTEAGSQPQPVVGEINQAAEVNEVDEFASDGDLIGELLPWLDEELAPAPAPPAVHEVPSDPLDSDSIDSLLAELTDTGPHPTVVPPPASAEPAPKNPLAMPKPALQARVAETPPPPPPPPPPPVVDRVRESMPAEMPPPPPPVPAPLAAEPARAPAQVALVAPAPEPVVVDAEPAEPVAVAPRSRLADRGLSDDLLPERDRRRRR